MRILPALAAVSLLSVIAYPGPAEALAKDAPRSAASRGHSSPRSENPSRGASWSYPLAGTTTASLTPPASGSSCTSAGAVASVSGTTIDMQIDAGGQMVTVRVPYYANRAIETGYSDISRAVVVVHGAHRDADNAYNDVRAAAATAGTAELTTLIVAPQFLTEGDIIAHDLPAEYLYWHCGGWKKGNLSLDWPDHPRPVRVSSFSVMDTLVERLAALNPNLQTIVLAGHSSGGQFVQRYAAGNQAHDTIKVQHGVNMEYVVSNVGSYMYLSPERRTPGTTASFSLPAPDVVQACPDYNEFKYGLEALNSYMGAVGAVGLADQYKRRQVTLLLGDEDTDTSDPLVDQTCPAELQGAHRFERGSVFYDYLGHLWAGDYGLHRKAVVAGVNHDPVRMYASGCSLYYLFGWGSPTC